MSEVFLYGLTGLLIFGAVGGAGWAFAGGMSGRTRSRVAAVAKVQSTGRFAALRGASQPDTGQRRKNVTALLKELEKQQEKRKERPTLRRRLTRAGLTIEPRTFWIFSAMASVGAAFLCFVMQYPWYATVGAAFGAGLGLPRWVVGFRTKRRQKKFTAEFANAIDVIVRSVKSGLPVNEALKVVASDIAEPVSTEFRVLNENLKVGVTMEDGLKRMFERMPTAEVNFFGIVMTIQQKTGGNLSEALQNLSNVLRDRKRLQGKIRAMSSEAKAGAMIIGSLPPGVVALISITSPKYIAPLFHVELGNLMLIGCGVWMTIGVIVMKKMVSFKY
jgi:tight adherence protein B